MSIAKPVYWLFILAIPIACIVWTVTHEEIFSEIRNYCKTDLKKDGLDSKLKKSELKKNEEAKEPLASHLTNTIVK